MHLHTQLHRPASAVQPPASRRLRGGLAALAGCLVLAAALPGAAGVFPDQAALTLKFSDDFETGSRVINQSGDGGDVCADCLWVEWENVATSLQSWQVQSGTTGMPSSIQGGSWGSYHLWGTGQSRSWWGNLLPKVSLPTDPSWDPNEWANIQMEVDFTLVQTQSPGLIWAAQDADGDRSPETGYIFRLRGISPASTSWDYIPWTQVSVEDGTDCTGWELRKITAENTYDLIARSDVNSACTRPLLPPTETYTVSDATDWFTKYLIRNFAYRMRLSWYCGNLRVQIVRIHNPVGTDPPIYRGCGAACGTGSTNVEDCWCTLVEWTPLPLEQPLDPGAAGINASGTSSSGSGTYQFFDNFKASYWEPDCGVVCGAWQGWQTVRTDIVPFKFLYEGGIFDISAGRRIDPAADRGKIDVATEAPGSVSGYNHSLDSNPYCNGWNLLEDLPSPAETTNLNEILAFLEPMHSAVKYESAGTGFSWVDDFDNDPVSASYNPVPMVADGSTPINSSLLQAYDWYRDQVTTGDWAADPYADCRQWYVILITDGDEACEFSGGVPNPGAVCEPGQAASKFANPPDVGVAPLPVYTIGFSESVAADSPLACIAEQTGGTFLTAENASQLSAALYDVFYTIEGGQRSFAPFKIAPPPSSLGGNPTRDYLAVFPFLQPLEGKTLWAGDLWAYRLNAQQKSLPTTGDCEIDTTQAAWNASAALAAQLAAHTEGNPQRFVYMGSDLSGAWQRYDLATMPDDAALRTEFKTLLNVSGGVTDVVAQQVVNFVRGIYMDDDYDTPGPPLAARPEGYPVLGDFFHSQPVIVNPPNNLRYAYDYGFGNHNYQDFMAQQSKRRRVVVAGANDGMLHVFDGGVWNRDRVNENDVANDPYDQIHDLGTGTELFAWVPQAVMGNLYHMTSGGDLVHVEQQYMVDGPIARSDVFIDHDSDGAREWRTVVLASMRRGGRGILALDITQPDPIGASPYYIPEVSTFAGCRVGSTTNCNGEYPKVLWEFTDTADANGNGQWDLGWTWSKPAFARIAIHNVSNPQQPDDVFVAFFGGGWDRDELDQTGTYFYGVDVATGAVLLKTNMSVDLPGGVTALDSNENGFHDRLYFADSDGGVWRMQFPAPTDAAATGAAAGTMTRIFDFRTAFPGVADRQEFFTRPVPVPALFDGANYTWAVALGSGDRANLKRTDSGIDHFFLLVDAGDNVTRGIANLLPVNIAELENLQTLTSQQDLDNAFECTSDALVPPYYGWYLSLRVTEKVNFDATILSGMVYFPTFDPSTATATSPPNVCASAETPETPVELDVVCRATGIGRSYKLSLICGQGGFTEYNDFATSVQGKEIDGQSDVVTGLSDEPPDEQPAPQDRSHLVTNWRQE